MNEWTDGDDDNRYEDGNEKDTHFEMVDIILESARETEILTRWSIRNIIIVNIVDDKIKWSYVYTRMHITILERRSWHDDHIIINYNNNI